MEIMNEKLVYLKKKKDFLWKIGIMAIVYVMSIVMRGKKTQKRLHDSVW